MGEVGEGAGADHAVAEQEDVGVPVAQRPQELQLVLLEEKTRRRRIYSWKRSQTDTEKKNLLLDKLRLAERKKWFFLIIC